MRTSLAATLVAAAFAAALMPAPADADTSVGANIGSARANGGDFDGTDTSWKLHAGTSMTEFIGGEISYVSFDGFDREVRAWAPAITIGVPLGGGRLYGKGGVSFADVEGQGLADEYSDEEPFWGVGLRFRLLPGVGFRTEYERYQVGPNDIDLAQVGLELTF